MVTVNIGFWNNVDNMEDETQFDVERVDELAEVFNDFCDENNFGRPDLLYIYSL